MADDHTPGLEMAVRLRGQIRRHENRSRRRARRHEHGRRGRRRRERLHVADAAAAGAEGEGSDPERESDGAAHGSTSHARVRGSVSRDARRNVGGNPHAHEHAPVHRQATRVVAAQNRSPLESPSSGGNRVAHVASRSARGCVVERRRSREAKTRGEQNRKGAHGFLLPGGLAAVTRAQFRRRPYGSDARWFRAAEPLNQKVLEWASSNARIPRVPELRVHHSHHRQRIAAAHGRRSRLVVHRSPQEGSTMIWRKAAAAAATVLAIAPIARAVQSDEDAQRKIQELNQKMEAMIKSNEQLQQHIQGLQKSQSHGPTTEELDRAIADLASRVDQAQAAKPIGSNVTAPNVRSVKLTFEDRFRASQYFDPTFGARKFAGTVITNNNGVVTNFGPGPFNGTKLDDDYLAVLNRIRMNLDIDVNDKLAAFFQLQSSRSWGGNSMNNTGTGGT